MRGKDHWRLVGILPPALRGRDDVTFEDVIPSVRGEAGAGLSFQACTWFSTYRIHHRSAARFRDRRCFLLGDAAHIHSPVGAQGMNTGLQDAYNLAWKLALVVEGRADAGAARLVRRGARAGRAAVAEHDRPGVHAGGLRQPARGAVPHADPCQDRGASRCGASRYSGSRSASSPRPASATGESRLSQTLEGLPDGAPRAGDRFPWLRLRLPADGPVEDLFREARRHAIQPRRDRAASASRRSARTSATSCAST